MLEMEQLDLVFSLLGVSKTELLYPSLLLLYGDVCWSLICWKDGTCFIVQGSQIGNHLALGGRVCTSGLCWNVKDCGDF